MWGVLFDIGYGFACAYLVCMMFSMGLALGGAPREEKTVKRRERRLLVRALVVNLVVFPLLALFLTKVLHASGAVVIALLLLAASPGGRFAPQLSKVAGAHLGLSVEITLFLAKLVPFTAPVTVRWMLHTQRIELHELGFIAQLVVLQLVPYGLGKQLRKRRPQTATRLARPFEVLALILLVPVVVIAVHEMGSVASVTSDRGWWAVLAFALVAPALGWMLGGPAPETRRAFAVIAGARNLAVALLIASVAFRGSNVRVAILAVWLLMLGLEFAWAKLVGARIQRAEPQPA